MPKAKEKPRQNMPPHSKPTKFMPATSANGSAVGSTSQRRADALSEQHEKVAADERLRILASLRENVRGIPAERHDEIFADFAKAAETRDIAYLADTILNWALGGHGYNYASEPVNRLNPIITATDNDEDKAIWEEMWTGGNR